MTELVEFLRARVAEDEAAARDASVKPDTAACEGDPASWKLAERYDTAGVYAGGVRRDNGYGGSGVFGTWDVIYDGDGPNIEVAEHIVRHDPARVLREIAAKRRIIEDYRIARSALDQTDSRGSLRAGSNAFFVACLALASVYSDHPDFNKHWAI